MKIHKGVIKGSLILLISTGLASFLHFFYQIIMARMLTLAEYGILAVLSSIIYVMLMFSESIQTIIVRQATLEKEEPRLKNILKKSLRKAFFVSILFFAIYLILSVALSFLLKINYLLLAFTGLIIFSVFFLPISRGMMQARAQFKPLGFNMIIEGVGKLAFGIIFVYMGFKVYGSILGIFLGGIIAFFFSFLSLKNIIKAKEEKLERPEIYSYAKPAFLITFIAVFFYSIDIIIARIFFSPEIVGSYAIASILSKAIFWGTLPISKAMFPLSANNQKMKEKSENVFYNSLLMVLACIFAALFIFYFFPNFVVRIFAGENIELAVGILFYLGIGTSLISAANLILLYKLSLGKTKNYLYLIFPAIIEIFLLVFFSKNVFQYSIAFITASAIFLFSAISMMND